MQLDYSSFSGHMVSSITEGEVKEKEAVVVKAVLENDQTVVSGVYDKSKFNK